MTDLRKLTILGLVGRLNVAIDEGKVPLSPAEVKRRIADGTILDHLAHLYGDFPEFNPIHRAEKTLLLRELKDGLEIYDGREASKMGVERNGLCLLVGYCIEMLVHRSMNELMRGVSREEDA
jgi:hypothetical protein